MKKLIVFAALFSCIKFTSAQFPEPATVEYSACVFYMGGSDSTYTLDWVPSNSFEIDPRRWTYGVKKAAISRDFQMGQYEITRQDYAEMLNYAYGKGWISVNGSSVYNEIGDKKTLVSLSNPVSGNSTDPSPGANQINWDGSTFTTDTGTENTALAYVTHYGAAFFCYALNDKYGNDHLYDLNTWTCTQYGLTGYRLPTEGEWTRVTRGANNSRAFMWDGVTQSSGSFFTANTNYIGSGYRDPIAVGQFDPQGENLDLYDMAANVAEWVQDWKDPYYHRYGGWHPLNPTGGNDFDGKKVTFGGSHDCPEHYFMYSYHWPHGRGSTDDRVGFRVVKTFASNNKAPKAEFWPEKDQVNVAEPVKYINVSMYDPTSFSWEFEGGNPATSTDTEPVVTYTTPGRYQVKLTATNQHGQMEELKLDIIEVGDVSTLPTAAFTASKTIICNGASVDFTNTSTGNPTYQWTFEGGTPTNSTDMNPTVSYNTPGTYDVTLVVTNQFGDHTLLEADHISVDNAKALPFTEGFESGIPNDWFINNPDAGLTWEGSALSGRGSSSSMIMNNADNSNIGEIDEITTPPLDLTTITQPQLSFDIAYTKFDDNSPDKLTVYVSTDCGDSWTQLWQKNHHDMETKVVATAQSNAWVPSVDGDWRTETIDLAAYSSEQSLKVKFENTSGYGTRVWLDNINLGTTLTNIDIHETVTFSIYPNPGQDFIVVSNDGKQDMEVTITNALGKTMFKKQMNRANEKLNTSNFSSGIYFITIKYNGTLFSKRWVKK